jgi:hypothetical protein
LTKKNVMNNAGQHANGFTHGKNLDRTAGEFIGAPLKGRAKRKTVSLRAYYVSGSIGHPPHSSASPVELRLREGPRALSGKKKELR